MSTYITSFVYGSVPYRDYLQTKSFVTDITDSTEELQMAVSKDAREMIATVEQLGEQQIKVLGSIAGEISDLRSELRGGFETICYGLKEISQGIEALDATFHWGFTEMLTELGRVNISLEELVHLVKNPAQTWAYEQFETGREALRQQLYPEAIEAFDHAINGFGPHVGYKLEYRFHYYLGIIYLGDTENTDPAILNLSKAEAAFLTAARYAKVDSPKEASAALMAAGWAAYCQGKMKEALDYTQQAIALDRNNGEAHFQSAKINMYSGNLEPATFALREAIFLDRNYSVKASADGDFQKHVKMLARFLENLRTKTVAGGKQQVESAEALVKQMREWHSQERSPTEFERAEKLLESAKKSVSSNTFYGGLDAASAAMEAGVLAQMAKETQVSGLRRSIDELFTRAQRDHDWIAEVANEHAPKAFSAAKSLLSEAVSKRAASVESYGKAQDDLIRIQAAMAALREATEFAQYRDQKVREITAHNDQKVPVVWWHGVVLYFTVFVAFTYLMGFKQIEWLEAKITGDFGVFFVFFPGLLFMVLSPWLIAWLRTRLKRKPLPEKK